MNHISGCNSVFERKKTPHFLKDQSQAMNEKPHKGNEMSLPATDEDDYMYGIGGHYFLRELSRKSCVKFR